MNYCGDLEIQLAEARNLKTGNHSSPYIKLYLDSEQKQSKVCHKGGTAPNWNEQILISVLPGMCNLRIECWDKELVHDKMVGEGFVDLTSVFQQGTKDFWVQLRTQKQSEFAGEVRLVCFFRSKVANQSTINPSIAQQQPVQTMQTGFTQQPIQSGSTQPMQTGFTQPMQTGFAQPMQTGFAQQPMQAGYPLQTGGYVQQPEVIMRPGLGMGGFGHHRRI
jgi:Ca2+-dependent lipid-binding protein